MTAEAVASIAAVVITVLGFLLALAVAWGRVKQVLEGLVTAVAELNAQMEVAREAREDDTQRIVALETQAEASGERLDRLELPIFRTKRH